MSMSLSRHTIVAICGICEMIASDYARERHIFMKGPQFLGNPSVDTFEFFEFPFK